MASHHYTLMNQLLVSVADDIATLYSHDPLRLYGPPLMGITDKGLAEGTSNASVVHPFTIFLSLEASGWCKAAQLLPNSYLRSPCLISSGPQKRPSRHQGEILSCG